MNTAMYKQFTPAERLRLVVMAQARGDVAEVVRLWESCPKMELVACDPRFPRRVDRTRSAVGAVFTLWLEISHHVIRDCLFVTALSLESECQSQKLRVEGGSEEAVATLQADYAARAATAEAGWRAASAVWKGIESGMTRFCAEVELTRDQLFAMVEWPPATIDQARGELHPDSRIGRDFKEGTYQRLRQAWRDENNE